MRQSVASVGDQRGDGKVSPGPQPGQLIQPQGLNSPCAPGPTLGVHLISSGSSQPPLEASDVKPLTEEEPKAP